MSVQSWDTVCHLYFNPLIAPVKSTERIMKSMNVFGSQPKLAVQKMAAQPDLIVLWTGYKPIRNLAIWPKYNPNNINLPKIWTCLCFGRHAKILVVPVSWD